MDPLLLRALLVGGVLLVTVLVGLVLRGRDGRVRSVGATGGGVDADAAPRLEPAQLAAVGLELQDAQAGALLLGAPACAPCDVVKGVLQRLADEREGFRWAYADAGEHLELATAHRVLRVPTLLVVAPSGRLLGRSSGVPSVEELRRLLDDGTLEGTAA